jgi:hypothetical protein
MATGRVRGVGGCRNDGYLIDLHSTMTQASLSNIMTIDHLSRARHIPHHLNLRRMLLLPLQQLAQNIFLLLSIFTLTHTIIITILIRVLLLKYPESKILRHQS